MTVDRQLKSGLSQIVPGRISFAVSLKEYSTIKVGGHADAVAFPENIAELKTLVAFLRAKNIDHVVVGAGSNIIFTDRGFRGVVVNLTKGFDAVRRIEGKPSLYAGAGLTLRRFVLFLEGQPDLGGYEFLAGIPGTVGGGIFMNAGANGREIKDILDEVTILNEACEIVTVDRQAMSFRYRSSNIPTGAVILGGSFSFPPVGAVPPRETISKILIERKRKQPIELPNVGSIFKNPDNQAAGKIIEGLGLKGHSIGGATISDKHANFIVNTGGASAEDVLRLIELIEEKVEKATGIKLSREVKIIGE